METGKSFFTLSSWFVIVAFLVVGLSGETCNAKCTSSCGNIPNISYPFRLKDDPKHCGDLLFTLSCENNSTLLVDLPPSGKYYVQAINYDNQTIRVVDPGIQKNNCSSSPLYPLAVSSQFQSMGPNGQYYPFGMPVTFLKCASPVNSPLYVDTAPCLNMSSSSQQKTHGYVMIGWTKASDFEIGCTVEWTTAMLDSYKHQLDNTSYEYIHSSLLYGFDVEYYTDRWCTSGWRVEYYYCFHHTISGFFGYVRQSIIVFLRKHRVVLFIIVGFFLARFMLGIGILIYKWRIRHISMYTTIEDFLRSDNFIPIRYSYYHIKRMTGGFKDKLGEGGYGSVFKGKLRSGRFGAIKMLGKPKANGQEFINEVATIGRIHHVNVVQLVGYCAEGSKRALVYDFMPNGSLDKYIYSKEGSIPLNCKKTFEISLGVARGIKYLHEGCDMQILHFDIKPHNILLDENFIPKISDFGLAKLYPIDNSIVSLTVARGTLGYMAPELLYKNIGGVSFKADVYSFGMLLMEMTTRRKNLNAFAEHSSQIYFPSWVYDQYNEGKDLEMGDVPEEEKEIMKKMVITALWCIQMKPSDRPSMKKVIEMLEGGVELLKLPPKPFLCPQEMQVGDLDQASLNQVYF